MGAVGMVAACETRRRWRSLVVLTLLVGVVGAIVLATAAGARRTDSALARFDVASRSDDVAVSGPFAFTPTRAQLDELRHVHDVAALAVLRFYALVPVHAPANLGIAAALDTKFGTVVDRGRLVAGRRADPAVADELILGEGLAARLHLRVGGHLDILSYSPAQFAAAAQSSGPPPAPAGPRVRLRIVGIYGPGDLGLAGQIAFLSPAFNRAYFDRIGNYGVIMPIRTVHGASDVPSVVAAARGIFRSSGGISLSSPGNSAQGAQNAINVLTLALWIFAGVAALAGIVAIAIVLTRDISIADVEQATLRALGLTRRQVMQMCGLRALLIAVGGGLLAVGGASAASTFFPIGLARRVDPTLGLHVDWVVLGVGVVVVAGSVLAMAFVAAWRSTRRLTVDAMTVGHRGSSGVAEIAARAATSPSMANGLRMAFDPGRRPSAVPIRSAYFGAVFGVLGITAVLVCSASLDHLVATPRLYGSNWDFSVVDSKFSNDVGGCGRHDLGLAATTGVAAVAGACTNDVELDGRAVTGWGFAPIRGEIEPEVVTGRAPRTSGEVALGAKTLEASGKRIGETVQGHGPLRTVRYRIVGQVVFPAIVDSPGNTQALADGAAFTGSGLARIFDGNSSSNRYLLGRFKLGADRAATKHRIAARPGLGKPMGGALPVEVDRLRHIGWFPVTLAVLLGGLALVAVGHALVTGVRRRRREFAVLKTLGFNRRQVRAAVAWQATTIATVGLLVGIPLGLLVGNLVWHQVADGLGVLAVTAIPALALMVAIPAALALVNLTAFFPARSAARTRPAVALRTE